MNKVKNLFLNLIIILMTLSSFTAPVSASESTEPNGFTIEGVTNSHQVTAAKKIGYFYLYEKPGEEDVLKVKLINYASTKRKLRVTVTDANTNKNGIIDYSADLKNSRYLKTPLTSLIEWKTKVFELAPREVKTISIPFKMPSKKYQGVIIGGINVYEEKEKDEDQPQLSMQNEYGYTLGVVLTNQNKKESEKNVSVKLDEVEPKLDYGRKIIQANIANPNPYIFSTTSISGSVTSLSDNKVILNQKMDKVRIAPYQVFPFQLDYAKQDMKPGKYLLKVDVKTDTKTWHFEREFEIKDTTAKEINKKSVFRVYIPKWLNFSLLLVVIISLGLTVYIIVRKVRRKDEKVEED